MNPKYQIDAPSEKTTLKKPRLIRVKLERINPRVNLQSLRESSAWKGRFKMKISVNFTKYDISTF